MKIALVHELITRNEGGAEYVLKLFSEMFPDAPIYTWVYDKKGASDFWRTKDIRTSYIQNLPFAKTKYPWYLMLMPSATDHFDLTKYDIVLSSSSNLIKGVITRPETLHIDYCHTPPRFLWTDTHEYSDNLRKPALAKFFMPLCLPSLRIYDKAAADRVDYFIANSKTVQGRIKKIYRRDSEVITAPVDLTQFYPADKISNYYLAGGRIMAYKRFDLVVTAFNRLNIPLIIFGDGPELNYLKKIAKKNITFLGKIKPEERRKLYSECIAFINPQEEDFGITPIEAMACGRPVIGYRRGGNLETIVEGKTGEFFDEQTWECLGEKIIKFKPENYNPQIIREHALQFSVENFKTKIKKFIDEKWAEHQQR